MYSSCVMGVPARILDVTMKPPRTINQFGISKKKTIVAHVFLEVIDETMTIFYLNSKPTRKLNIHTDASSIMATCDTVYLLEMQSTDCD